MRGSFEKDLYIVSLSLSLSDMISKRFFAFGLIFLFAFSFASAGFFDWFSKKEITGNAIENKYDCIDPDQGNNEIFMNTTVIQKKTGTDIIKKTKKDHCINSSKVMEYSCYSNGNINNLKKDCPQGYSCKDGSCVVKNSGGNSLLDIKTLSISYSDSNYGDMNCNEACPFFFESWDRRRECVFAARSSQEKLYDPNNVTNSLNLRPVVEHISTEDCGLKPTLSSYSSGNYPGGFKIEPIESIMICFCA